jgi:hypothetical protein
MEPGAEDRRDHGKFIQRFACRDAAKIRRQRLANSLRHFAQPAKMNWFARCNGTTLTSSASSVAGNGPRSSLIVAALGKLRELPRGKFLRWSQTASKVKIDAN